MKLPVTVSAPNSTSKPSAAICGRDSPAARRRRPPLVQVLGDADERGREAPNMCDTAMRCGIAVIGTRVPSG
jgi:hypothetical protein